MSETSTTPAEVTPVAPAEATPVDQLRETLQGIELDVLTGFTLADAMREGSSVTEQAYNWGSGAKACAWSAARISAEARGFIPQ